MIRAALVAMLAAGSFQVHAAAADVHVRVPDLGDRLVDPWDVGPGVRAIVFVFTSIDCPLSNRYAPEVRRLSEAFEPRGVRFWLVFSNPAESPAAVRAHLSAFGHPAAALRDTRQDLARIAKATVTPETAVFAPDGRLLYRGRIDDRYAEIGVERPMPTRHDLEDALTATLAGRPVAESTTRAVGCFLTDFLR